MKVINYSLLLSFLLSTVPITSALQCVDEEGQTVEWFVLYKLPRHKKDDTEAEAGLGYAYLTPNSAKHGWTISNLTIDNEHSIPGRTLSPIFKDLQNPSNSLMHLSYNDQPPVGDGPTSFRHTKGVLAFEHDKGFWLVHSVPRFANFSKPEYSFPSSGETYGQTFLCISLRSSESVNSILDQLLYNTPDINSLNIPPWFKAMYPKVEAVIRGDQEKSHVSFHKTQLRSIGGTLFTSFAKNAKFHRDLYANFVAPELKTSLLVESWVRGSRLDPWCKGKYHVENVGELQFPITKVDEYDFKETKDHSKWAISKLQEEKGHSNEVDRNIVCIGDINRMKTQFRRGGGTVCFENSNVWTAFNELVKFYDSC